MQLCHLAFDAKILLPLQSRPSRWLKAEQGRGGRAEAEKGRSAPPATEQRGWRELFPPWSAVSWADVLLSHRTAATLSSRSEPPCPPGRRPSVFQPSPQGAASPGPMLMIQSLLPPPNTARASPRSVGPRRQPAHGRSLRECFSGTLTSGRLSVASARDPPQPPSHAGLCAAPGWGRQQTRHQRAGGPPFLWTPAMR